jgi:Tfp pilus assembly protein PilV
VRSTDPDKPPCRARLRARLAAACAAGRSRLRAERGSMLIEVMVGALVLALATTAVLNGLDGAQKTGGRNKARSVAAALAEQDQERMHSMPVTDLLTYINTPYTRTVTVKGVNYTVTSSASYANDPGAVTTGCSATAKTQTNLRILSSVTSPLTRGTVDLVGLVTPPGSTGVSATAGRLIVKVVDRDQAAIQGVNVSLSGTASFSEDTNEAGCAVFPFAPAGNYTASISKLGLVDWDGDTTITPEPTLTSTAGQTTTYGAYELDQPATINAQFDTRVASTTVNAKARWITVNNVKLAAQRLVFDSGAQNTTVPAAGLFPFLDGYGIYAGQCTPQNVPGTLPNTAPGPGATVTTSPKIRVPSINLRVVNSTSTSGAGPAGQNGVTLVIKTADGCANTFPNQTSASMTYGGTTYAGAIPEPGFPYGNYKICAQRTVSGVVRHGHADVFPFTTAHVDETVVNTNANGNTPSWNVAGSIRVYVSTAATPPAAQAGPCH